jgi:hypothetical protein
MYFLHLPFHNLWRSGIARGVVLTKSSLTYPWHEPLQGHTDHKPQGDLHDGEGTTLSNWQSGMWQPGMAGTRRAHGSVGTVLAPFVVTLVFSGVGQAKPGSKPVGPDVPGVPFPFWAFTPP